ncbi:MAG: hypothetical protein ACJAT2_001895 [Bacteriovoracaceae bacterium]|jgi:hypothetical protein
MAKDKNVRKRKKREEKKKQIKGKSSLKTDFSPEEKVAGKMHLYILGGLTALVSVFLIYSYSK